MNPIDHGMFFLKLLSRLPFGILYAVSDLLYYLSYYVIRYRRDLVWKQLARSFPEKTKQDLLRIQKKFYRNLCDYAVETLKLLTIDRSDLMKRMVFTNPELITSFYTQKRSLLYLASHQFNWEWLLVAGSISLPFPVEFVYQRVNSPFANNLSLACRARFGAKPILRDDVAREALRRKHELRGIAIVGDQYPGYGRDKKYATQFLNQDTVFFFAINQLALLTQYTAVYFDVKKIRRGYYTATAVVVGEPPYDSGSEQVIEGYVRAVEQTICKNPDGWLWSHNRWKTRHLRQA